MPVAIAPNGINIEYDVMGDPADPPLLWVMGFTAQLIAWSEEFMQLFVDLGYFVIRFDNRDCGLSTKFDGVVVDADAIIKAALLEDPVPVVPYTLSDMATDAVAVLDHLGIARAHVIGASMGGMIAQTIAIEHPSRVHTLTSIMSQTGDPEYGQPGPEALSVLFGPPETDRTAYIEGSVKYAVWQSKKYFDPVATKERAAREFDRSFYPEGSSRQLAAIYASGRRSEKLSQLNVPTLVIHGRDDALITQSGGERTAEVIPGAHLLLLSDMGHDMPQPLWPILVDSIASHVKRNL
ncbi:MAG: alpha/beta hydrolase [Ilumatobacteraceae bacterium]|nr:alpha/beta hydrolase [Ilumatobacteraceae bacterium]